MTGATGKTTTKEAIADVLATRAPTFRSWRNYNDLLGIPLSLGRLEPEQRFAVLELAADHPGEMRALAALTRPSVAVVTNVSPTHLHYFGSLDALARELAELPAALPAEGLAVLNGADAATRAMRECTAAQVALFGEALPAINGRGTVGEGIPAINGRGTERATKPAAGAPANEFAPEWPAATKSACADSEQAGRNNTVGARHVSPGVPHNKQSSSSVASPAPTTRYAVVPLGSREPLALTLQPLDASGNPVGEPVVFPNLIGDHWATAVLAALTVGQAFGVDRDAALAALRKLQPLPGRMRLLDGADGLALLDDTHNATPASASAGLAALNAIGAARHIPRIAVLGEMLRLGDAAGEAHLSLGREVAAIGGVSRDARRAGRAHRRGRAPRRHGRLAHRRHAHRLRCRPGHPPFRIRRCRRYSRHGCRFAIA